MSAPTPTTRPPVRVVHVLGALDRGGAETVALELCRRVPTDAVVQVFVCLSGREGSLAPDFRATGATVVPLALRPLPTFPVRLARLLREHRPDSLVSHVSLATAPVLAVGAATGVRQRVARLHSQDDGRGAAPLRRAYRALMRGLLAVTATDVAGVTDAAVRFGLGRAAHLAAARGVRVQVLPNGVDTTRFAPGPPVGPPAGGEALVVVHVGRPAPEKNRRILPPILDELRRGGPAELRVVGSWSVDDVGPGADRLTVVGPTDDVPDQLRAADVTVLPSHWEGLPGVVLESLACGTPVVATDLEGIREIAAHCRGVRTVPAGAPPQTWATVLRDAATAEPGPQVVRASFVASPYVLDRTVDAWRALWGAPSGRDRTPVTAEP